MMCGIFPEKSWSWTSCQDLNVGIVGPLDLGKGLCPDFCMHKEKGCMVKRHIIPSS